MKRINILPVLFIVIVLFVACSESLEHKASKRYKNLFLEIAPKTATLEVSEPDILFSDDSICVLQYSVDAGNYSGDKASFRMEYFLLRTEKDDNNESELYEATYILDKERGSLLDNEIIHYDKILHENIPDDISKRRKTLRMLAIVLTPRELRKVEE